MPTAGRRWGSLRGSGTSSDDREIDRGDPRHVLRIDAGAVVGDGDSVLGNGDDNLGCRAGGLGVVDAVVGNLNTTSAQRSGGWPMIAVSALTEVKSARREATKVSRSNRARWG
jgi:hypothetical protein